MSLRTMVTYAAIALGAMVGADRVRADDSQSFLGRAIEIALKKAEEERALKAKEKQLLAEREDLLAEKKALDEKLEARELERMLKEKGEREQAAVEARRRNISNGVANQLPAARVLDRSYFELKVGADLKHSGLFVDGSLRVDFGGGVSSYLDINYGKTDVSSFDFDGDETAQGAFAGLTSERFAITANLQHRVEELDKSTSVHEDLSPTLASDSVTTETQRDSSMLEALSLEYRANSWAKVGARGVYGKDPERAETIVDVRTVGVVEALPGIFVDVDSTASSTALVRNNSKYLSGLAFIDVQPVDSLVAHVRGGYISNEVETTLNGVTLNEEELRRAYGLGGIRIALPDVRVGALAGYQKDLKGDRDGTFIGSADLAIHPLPQLLLGAYAGKDGNKDYYGGAMIGINADAYNGTALPQLADDIEQVRENKFNDGLTDRQRAFFDKLVSQRFVAEHGGAILRVDFIPVGDHTHYHAGLYLGTSKVVPGSWIGADVTGGHNYRAWSVEAGIDLGGVSPYIGGGHVENKTDDITTNTVYAGVIIPLEARKK